MKTVKTAVSLPGDVFKRAERLAQRTQKTRSRLFSEALREYVARHAPEEITEAMNAALDRIGEEPDAFVSAASRRVLKRTAW